MKFRSVILICLVLVRSESAFGVIAAKIPVGKMVETAKSVLVARVTQLNPANRVLDVELLEALKGEGAAKMRVQVVKPAEIFADVKAGDPIIIFTGKGRESNKATIHLGGGWYIAEATPETSPPSAPVFKIVLPQSNDFSKAFPGSTTALTGILREIKTQKPTYLVTAEERLFGEGASQVSQLNVTASALFAADLDGDKVPELLVATTHGPRIFSSSGGNYIDTSAKWSLPAEGALLAVGDLNGDGKTDLLIEKTPYLLGEGGYKAGAAVSVASKAELLSVAIANGRVLSLTKDGQFSNSVESKQVWKDGQTQLAAVIGPFDEENKIAAVVLSESGLIRYSLDGQVADFTRLTGESLATYLKDSGGKFKNPKLVPLDANGDGRKDLLVLSEGANFLLINRGFGAFFVSPAAASLALGAGADKPFPYASSATAAHWAAIDTRGDHHEDLLILTQDGALHRLGNPPPK